MPTIPIFPDGDTDLNCMRDRKCVSLKRKGQGKIAAGYVIIGSWVHPYWKKCQESTGLSSRLKKFEEIRDISRNYDRTSPNIFVSRTVLRARLYLRGSRGLPHQAQLSLYLAFACPGVARASKLQALVSWITLT